MAHAYSDPDYGFSPEEGLHQIQIQRKRKFLLALGVGLLAFLVFGLGIYLAYNDVPAPDTPANAKPNIVEPYR